MDFSRDAAVRLGAAMLLAVVFGGGAALGFAIDRDNGSEIRESPSIPDVPRPDRSQRPSEWIIDRLDLSTEQRSRVDSVVDHFGARMRELQKEYRPQYRVIVDSTDRALRVLLSEEQQVRYDSLDAAAERWRARNRSRERGR